MTGAPGAGGTVHIIGAGVSGLAAAVALAGVGGGAGSARTGGGAARVRVWEAAGHAGGRCRSFHDTQLGIRIDNGNHLLLSGNRAVNWYLGAVGAAAELTGPAEARFDFYDAVSGGRWTVRPGAGVSPLWLFDAARRAPGASALNHLRALRLAWAAEDDTAADVLGGGAAFTRLWEPFTVGVLNTAADEASARLLWPVVRETFGRGGRACIPRFAKRGLSEAFVDPALAFLAGKGAEVNFNARVRALEFSEGRVSGFSAGASSGECYNITLEAEDSVILAAPPETAARLVPGLEVPDEHRAILNAHFRVENVNDYKVLGFTGGLAQWAFTRPGLVSVTVSAADSHVGAPAEGLARRLWRDAAAGLNLPPDPIPPHRILTEKRATIAQTPAMVKKRPKSAVSRASSRARAHDASSRARAREWPNLHLAGDWTATGLPATVEGAVRSGVRAAAGVCKRLEKQPLF
ncbi:MAG: hydroxysqualene dehydroxylase HpnE [Rhodospirillales bacterium]